MSSRVLHQANDASVGSSSGNADPALQHTSFSSGSPGVRDNEAPYEGTNSVSRNGITQTAQEAFQPINNFSNDPTLENPQAPPQSVIRILRDVQFRNGLSAVPPAGPDAQTSYISWDFLDHKGRKAVRVSPESLRLRTRCTINLYIMPGPGDIVASPFENQHFHDFLQSPFHTSFLARFQEFPAYEIYQASESFDAIWHHAAERLARPHMSRAHGTAVSGHPTLGYTDGAVMLLYHSPPNETLVSMCTFRTSSLKVPIPDQPSPPPISVQYGDISFLGDMLGAMFLAGERGSSDVSA